ncbi:MAG: branched-chain amino acid aminotransferase [Rhodospirillales bacterium]|jgi:branched-chain amino acid aminotransferase|nr:branched-chain amino acid aminotransferase [Rhodospirillales bacterium]MBT4006601.1 branched-chain amino acid aminotransferase [Rhodospirillales bacterium]MBT5075820.1 branched-chain amino acid aminotransferase [Rhodospirillales bacterium]MBT5113879.1 branched-chain amino acid aminotransferase [Rhodospirillales bacterium]MBT5672407.1 branched-chain amino acid aminotransferase [Rhodospirillales bacterium]
MTKTPPKTSKPTPSIHFIDGVWIEGNPPIIGPMSNAAWMASVAFDGVRYFDNTMPDLKRHAERSIRSAQIMGLEPTITADEICARAWEGVDQMGGESALYIRPMFYAEEGFVTPKPESTRFVLTLFESPLPEPKGFTAHISRIRRPTPESAPTLAKASCLYPQSAQALREARKAGFGNGVVLDFEGNVAEFATANIFLAKDNVVFTPKPNGTFLDGITRQRVIALLRENDVVVDERSVGPQELADADEIFSTGNYAKVTPLIKMDDQELAPGPFYLQARRLYFEWAKSATRT